jgi:hypothetical protein
MTRTLLCTKHALIKVFAPRPWSPKPMSIPRPHLLVSLSSPYLLPGLHPFANPISSPGDHIFLTFIFNPGPTFFPSHYPSSRTHLLLRPHFLPNHCPFLGHIFSLAHLFLLKCPHPMPHPLVGPIFSLGTYFISEPIFKLRPPFIQPLSIIRDTFFL